MSEGMSESQCQELMSIATKYGNATVPNADLQLHISTYLKTLAQYGEDKMRPFREQCLKKASENLGRLIEANDITAALYTAGITAPVALEEVVRADIAGFVNP